MGGGGGGEGCSKAMMKIIKHSDFQVLACMICIHLEIFPSF